VEAVLDDYTTAPIGDDERALFAFIAKVSVDSRGVRQADVEAVRAAGWSDEAIYDAITVCALFRFYNTWVDASGVSDMPAIGYRMSGERLARHGYVGSSPPAADARVPEFSVGGGHASIEVLGRAESLKSN